MAAGGADHQASGHRNIDVVPPEVRVELAVGMELVGVPTAARSAADSRRLVNGRLREPLAHEVEVAHVAGALAHLRKMGLEVDIEATRPDGGTGAGRETRTTVRSSALSSSGCSKVIAGKRSWPSSRTSRHRSPPSRQNVLREFLKALR